MKTKFLRPFAVPRALLALAMAGAFLGTSTGTLAAIGETSSGVVIENLATLNYSVAGTGQAAIGSTEGGNTSGAGVTTKFTVDNKVNLSLSELSTTFTAVAPGSSGQATAFTLTNTGNSAQAYALTAANLTGATVFGLADTFDVTAGSFLIYVDANNDGILQAGELSAGAITSVATLARDTSIGLIVTASIPAGQANGTQAAISLTAIARAVGAVATPLVEAANTQNGVENVFADPAITTASANGTIPIQAGRDATAIAYDAYRIAAAILSVSKTSTLICDPFNGTASPKNIPGAIVRWTITVSNAGTAAASATLATIGDSLNANTTHDSNLVTGAGAPATATSCTSAGGAPESGTAGRGFQIESSVVGRLLGGVTGSGYMTNTGTLGTDDGASIAGAVGSQVVTVDFGFALPAGGAHSAGELKPGESAIVTFNVTIN